MGTCLRRRSVFHPSLDGIKLEDRLVLSTLMVAQAEGITATTEDPLVPTNRGQIKTSQVEATATQLRAAFTSFLNQTNRAANNAVRAVGRGQTEANALASLRAFTALQGGTLEARVQQTSRRLPGGVQYLLNPPQGTVPGGYPNDGTSGPDLRYYVPPGLRLKTQIDNMLATLNANATTLQDAVGQNSALTILQTYQSSRATTTRFINFSVANGDFTQVRG